MKKKLLSLVAMLGIATGMMAQVTFTCTAGKNFGGNEGMDKLFDGKTSTKYCQNAGDDCYALVTASQAVYVWGYDLTTANDNESYGRMVKAWKLYGTNDADVAADKDAEGWVSLSEQKNDCVQKKNYYTQRFFCNKEAGATAYKYFKVLLTEGGFIQASEFAFCYQTYPVVTYDWYASSSDNSKKAVDLSLTAKWEGNNLAGNWVTLKASDDQPHSVTGYSFSTHDDGDWNNRAPKDWKIEGSNDNNTWELIDEVTDKDPIANENYKTFSFTPSNMEGAYKYIRLTLVSMKGTGWTQVGEFYVNGGCATHTWEAGDIQSATCIDAGGTNYKCTVCGASKFVMDIPANGIHAYTDGKCVNCGLYENFIVDGVVTVNSLNDLKKIADLQAGQLYANTFDIVLNANITCDEEFKGINNQTTIPFRKTFDGKGYTITGFKHGTHVNEFSQTIYDSEVGFIGQTEGATIKNLILRDVYVEGNQNVGCIAGRMRGGELTNCAVLNSKAQGRDHIGTLVGDMNYVNGVNVGVNVNNCYSDSWASSTTYQCGGLVGTSCGGTLQNCVFTGKVSNANYRATGLVSLIDADAVKTTIKNNLMLASQIYADNSSDVNPIVNKAGRACNFESNHVLASTLYKEKTAYSTKNFTDANDENGESISIPEVLYKRFGLDENIWKYIEGKYPTLKIVADADAMTPVVDTYIGDAKYRTLKADVQMSCAEVSVYAAQNKGSYIHLEPMIGIKDGDVAVVKAEAAGVYRFVMDKAVANAAITPNDLIASTETVTADGTQYILGQNEDTVGFYKAKADTKIAAGKGYIIVSAGTKAFLPFGEDDATAISNVNINENGAVIYNVAGQRINKMQKGINIVNGKKVLF